MKTVLLVGDPALAGPLRDALGAAPFAVEVCAATEAAGRVSAVGPDAIVLGPGAGDVASALTFLRGSGVHVPTVVALPRRDSAARDQALIAGAADVSVEGAPADVAGRVAAALSAWTRATPRRPLPAVFRAQRGAERLELKVAEIDPSGFSLSSPGAVAAGELLKVQVPLPSGSFVAWGRVVEADDVRGVRFLALSDDERHRLLDAIHGRGRPAPAVSSPLAPPPTDLPATTSNAAPAPAPKPPTARPAMPAGGPPVMGRSAAVLDAPTAGASPELTPAPEGAQGPSGWTLPPSVAPVIAPTGKTLPPSVAPVIAPTGRTLPPSVAPVLAPTGRTLPPSPKPTPPSLARAESTLPPPVLVPPPPAPTPSGLSGLFDEEPAPDGPVPGASSDPFLTPAVPSEAEAAAPVKPWPATTFGVDATLTALASGAQLGLAPEQEDAPAGEVIVEFVKTMSPLERRLWDAEPPSEFPDAALARRCLALRLRLYALVREGESRLDERPLVMDDALLGALQAEVNEASGELQKLVDGFVSRAETQRIKETTQFRNALTRASTDLRTMASRLRGEEIVSSRKAVLLDLAEGEGAQPATWKRDAPKEFEKKPDKKRDLFKRESRSDKERKRIVFWVGLAVVLGLARVLTLAPSPVVVSSISIPGVESATVSAEAAKGRAPAIVVVNQQWTGGDADLPKLKAALVPLGVRAFRIVGRDGVLYAVGNTGPTDTLTIIRRPGR